jgi:hypothetical protein
MRFRAGLTIPKEDYAKSSGFMKTKGPTIFKMMAIQSNL